MSLFVEDNIWIFLIMTVFFGGGAEMWLNFSDALSLNAWYSYLNNESRPPVSTTEDVYGEHMFFVGMVLRFTGVRR